jgi:hypothetical protein
MNITKESLLSKVKVKLYETIHVTSSVFFSEPHIYLILKIHMHKIFIFVFNLFYIIQ